MAKVYVAIPKRVGDYKVTIGGTSWHELAAAGAGIGATAGSIIPGFGNAVGSVIGAIGGAVGSILGLSSGRDEVRDTMRKILSNAFGSILPGKVAMIGSARDVADLQGQYRLEDIKVLLAELRTVTLETFSPGGDTWNDLNLAFGSIEFNTGERSGYYTLMRFELLPAYTPSPDPQTRDEEDAILRKNQRAADESIPVGPDSRGSVSPAVLAGIAVLTIVGLAR